MVPVIQYREVCIQTRDIHNEIDPEEVKGIIERMNAKMEKWLLFKMLGSQLQPLDTPRNRPKYGAMVMLNHF